MPVDTITIITINGIPCYTVKQFAILTSRGEYTIRYLIKFGNKEQKLKSIKTDDRLFIPVTEYTEFPFSDGGKNGKRYHFNEAGERIYK